MCLGVPLRVSRLTESGEALCVTSAGSEARPVNVALLDAPPAPGDWLLVHVDVAIRAIDATEAREICDALEAVTLAAAGEPFEHLLADLIDRTPTLPPHLQSKHQEAS